MTFFPLSKRGKSPPQPASAGSPAAVAAGGAPQLTADLLDLGLEDGEGAGGRAGASDTGPEMVVTKGVGRGVVFEGLSLPGVVHEETRAVDTENASLAASVEVRWLFFAAWFFVPFFEHVRVLVL